RERPVHVGQLRAARRRPAVRGVRRAVRAGRPADRRAGDRRRGRRRAAGAVGEPADRHARGHARAEAAHRPGAHAAGVRPRAGREPAGRAAGRPVPRAAPGRGRRAGERRDHDDQPEPARGAEPLHADQLHPRRPLLVRQRRVVERPVRRGPRGHHPGGDRGRAAEHGRGRKAAHGRGGAAALHHLRRRTGRRGVPRGARRPVRPVRRPAVAGGPARADAPDPGRATMSILTPAGPGASCRLSGSIGLAAQVVAAALFIALLVVNLVQVVLRAAGGGFVWVTDLSQLMLLWLVMIGTVAAYCAGEHIVTGYLDRKLAGRAQGVLLLGLRVLEALFFFVLIVAGWSVTTVRAAIPYVQLGISTG